MHCPDFIYDMAVARTASEYLSSELALDAFAKKYADGLSERYTAIAQESFQGPAEGVLQFLSEIEAGEQAVELLGDYAYFRLYFEGVGRPRRMKPLFGSLEDGAKAPQINVADAAKAFRVYVFGQRSNTAPKAPDGWQLENETAVPVFAALAAKSVSVIDLL